MADQSVLLGTSGWSYKHWKGRFYPSELPLGKWFEFFTRHFQTVELNASFYRIPTVKVTQGWHDRSPEEFRFSVKVSRLITHVKRLKDCARELEWFFSVFDPLKKKVSVFLLQLPPNMKYEPDRLERFFPLLPSEHRYAIELRNSSWYTDNLFDLLRSENIMFCIHDMPDINTPKVVTSDSVYLRFHGYHALYGGDYPPEELERWAEWISSLHREGRGVLGYFNNDLEGFAVKNCLMLKRMVAKELESDAKSQRHFEN